MGIGFILMSPPRKAPIYPKFLDVRTTEIYINLSMNENMYGKKRLKAKLKQNKKTDQLVMVFGNILGFCIVSQCDA